MSDQMWKIMKSMYSHKELRKEDERAIQSVVTLLTLNMGFAPDRRIQKAFFLAEVWSIEERLTRLTRADFASWTHGPWSLQVKVAEEDLQWEGILRPKQDVPKKYKDAEFLEIVKIPKSFLSLKEEDEKFIKSFADQIRFIDSEKLTQLAKTTKPYLSTKDKEIIDLDGYLKEMKEKQIRFQDSDRVARFIGEAEAESWDWG